MVDLNVDGFADSLGAGLERLVNGDLSILVDMPQAGAPLDAETAAQLGRMLQTVVRLSSFTACLEGAGIGIAQTCGMSEMQIRANAELGRRAGRRMARKMIDKITADAIANEPND